MGKKNKAKTQLKQEQVDHPVAFQKKFDAQVEHSLEILFEISNLLPTRSRANDLENAYAFLLNIYSKAPFLFSWTGAKVVSSFKYIFAHYSFTEQDILKALADLEEKRQQTKEFPSGGPTGGKLGYRRPKLKA